MYEYDEYFEEPGAFDQEVEGFKETLRDAVKQEIKDKIDTLTAENKEQAEKLANLTALELAAEQQRIEYERKLRSAEFDAHTKVKQEGVRKLLEVLAEPRYKLGFEYISQPKCDKCDDTRNLIYTTPRGRIASERCECSERTMFIEVKEQYVHEIAKRNGELVVWYADTKGHYDPYSRDAFSHSKVLKSAAGVPDEELMKDALDYGYASKEEAQRIADALNDLNNKDKTGAESWL